ncbi:hypothetical protein GCM10011581_32070 [Saccharopolyspora subtropica]|uniref:SseB protein N-terminal domain-containing protein n=1 Tax=Saccharopolyspora thermophila TaxID=89367 RepID=A0A917NDV5_9PSEU|nr:SseB family protein [Saccharopolyspora subtropica]GGI92479.1 hypothetical protein GCM10011581_32070 [Saccharopolyspora subtropica]
MQPVWDEPPIVREALRFRRTLERPEDLVATFRSAGVYLECTTEPPTVPVVQVDGVPWLPVFSDLRFLADYRSRRGETGEVEYLQLTGARLLDTYLLGMPRGTSLLLDPAQEHTVALPALSGIAPTAIDSDHPARPVAEVSPYDRPVMRAWGGRL